MAPFEVKKHKYAIGITNMNTMKFQTSYYFLKYIIKFINIVKIIFKAFL